MRDHRGPGIEPYHADSPWRALAKERILAMVHHGLDEQFPASRFARATQPIGETATTCFAADIPRHRSPRIPAIRTALGSGGGQARVRRASVPRAAGAVAGPQNRILALRSSGAGSCVSLAEHGGTASIDLDRK